MRHDGDNPEIDEIRRRSGNRSSLRVVAAVALAAGFAIPGTLLGDVFLLTDGKKIGGTVLESNDDALSIWTARGTIAIERDRIAKQKTSRTDYDRYLVKLERTQRTVKSQLTLAQWCEKRPGLEAQTHRHYTNVIELDPDHRLAHQHLGHRKIEGQWRTLGDSQDHGSRKEDPRAAEGESAEIPPVVLIRFSEGSKIGEKAERHIGSELRKLLRDADRPMHFVTRAEEPDYELEIHFEAIKGNRSTFYGHGIQQQWIGRFDATLTRVGPPRKVAISIQNLNTTFSGRVELPEAEAREHTTRESIGTLLEKLKKHKFFRTRGLRKETEAPKLGR